MKCSLPVAGDEFHLVFERSVHIECLTKCVKERFLHGLECIKNIVIDLFLPERKEDISAS